MSRFMNYDEACFMHLTPGVVHNYVYIHVQPYLSLTFHLDVLVSMEDLYHTELSNKQNKNFPKAVGV